MMVGESSSASGRVLIIAGTDSSGGAGISRDIETVHAHGLRSCPVITAVTAQTDTVVLACNATAASLVQQQIETALQSNNIKAIKIGMLANTEIVMAIVSSLLRIQNIPVVLDPVLVSSSGTKLLEGHGVKTLKEKLLPLCTLVTPNLPEAAVLTGTSEARDSDAIAHQATALLKMGARNVLIKGGHRKSMEATDILFDAKGGVYRFSGDRTDFDMRGTGCALASAITANIAIGLSVETSCDQAKTYVAQLFKNHYH